MRIVSILPFPVEVPHLGISVEPNEVVEVDDDKAAALLASGAWEPEPEPEPKKSARTVKEK